MTPKSRGGRGAILVKQMFCPCFWSVPGVSQKTRNHTKIKKKCFGAYFSTLKKTRRSRPRFSRLFDAPGRSRNPKIHKKRTTVVQNRWSQVLVKKLKLLKKCPKIVPSGTPKATRKSERILKNLISEGSRKYCIFDYFVALFWDSPQSWENGPVAPIGLARVVDRSFGPLLSVVRRLLILVLGAVGPFAVLDP